MIRRIARLATVLVVSAPAALTLVVLAPPAFAAADGTLSLDQSVASASSNVTATVSLARRCNALGQSCNGPGRLTITRPDGASVMPDGSSSGSQSVQSTGSNYSFTIDAESVRRSVRNGTWTVTLVDSSGGTTSRSFASDFAPEVPINVGAQGDGSRQVDVWWTKRSEPDLTGFEINDGQGHVQAVGMDACSGSSCRVLLTYDNSTPGTYDYSFTVRSLRNSGQSGKADLRSASSRSANAQLVTPQPSPTPTTEPTTGPSSGPTSSPAPGQTSSPQPGGGSGGSPGGGTGGGSGGGTGGGSGGGTPGGGTGAGPAPKPGTGTNSPAARTPVLSIPKLNPIVAQRRTFALSFNNFSASLGIPKLPPLPATVFSAPDEGTFAPTLPYASPAAELSETSTNVLTSPLATVTSIDLDAAQLAKSLAFALVLLMIAAHLRLFLRTQDDD